MLLKFLSLLEHIHLTGSARCDCIMFYLLRFQQCLISYLYICILVINAY